MLIGWSKRVLMIIYFNIVDILLIWISFYICNFGYIFCNFFVFFIFKYIYVILINIYFSYFNTSG